MNWRPSDPRQSNKRGAPNDRLDQARKAKAGLLAAPLRTVSRREVTPEAPPPSAPTAPLRDHEAQLKALSTIPLWRLGDAQALRVSGPYLELAKVTLLAMETKEREAVLCWPDCTPSASAVSVLLALADCAAAAPLRIGELDARAAPVGLRALIYPYASTAHRALRQVYVDKSHVGGINLKHQIRTMQPGEIEALADFHKALARSNTLTGRAIDGKTYDEFRHPCLDELLPFGSCMGSDGRRELLWRVRTKTDLKLISRSGEADDPATARFFLFGLRANDSVVPNLKALKKRLDVIFFDLSATGRSRLGRDWLSRIRQFLEQADDRLGHVATIALTDDPWTFDALRFDCLPRGSARKTHAPAYSRVVFATQPDIAADAEAPATTYSAIKKHEVSGFSGEVEGVLQALRASARAADEVHDRDATELLRQLIGVIRRCSCLPASRDTWSSYLEDAVGGQTAADLQTGYRVASQTNELRRSVGPWAQLHGGDRDALLRRVESVWANTAELTPMAPMLRDTVEAFLNKSSSTAILFQKDMLADFAAHALTHDQEIGDDLRSRIEKDMILFLDKNGLDDISRLPGPRRNYIKTLIVVAPTRAQLLRLLAREWLPDNLIVLGDSDTLERCAADARRLAGYRELGPIADRFMRFAAKADALPHRHTGAANAHDPADEVEFPTSSIVNLAGRVRPDQPTIRFKLSGDQVLLARPGTKLIVQDAARTVPVFLETEAKDVEENDRLCLISDAFLEMARPILNIAVRAAEEIRDYHELVLQRFADLPGDSQSAKLAHVVATMAMPDVSVQRAHYWIDLEAQRDVELHEVVPHAPRDRATYDAFTKALSITDVKSKHYWIWAVIAQRSSRLRAAISFHEAYRSILVDNYAAQGGDPKRAAEIRRLKAAAQDFVSQVVEKTLLKGDHAAT